MGGLFFLAGVILAAYSGLSALPWYFVLISSGVIVLGYLIIRAPQIHGILSRDGVMALPKLLVIQLLTFSVITAPIFFISSLMS
jgi:hypothetical protein